MTAAVSAARMTGQAGASDRAIAIVPSLLDIDVSRLGDEVVELERAGADRLQWDIMDGHFVPRLTHGADPVRSVRPLTSLPFEVHLMVDEPERLWPAFAEAGADILIVHAETTRHLHRLLSEIRAAGKATGVALNPATPIDAVCHVIDLVDLLLVMTVNPGWGGQAFIPAMLDKVAEARSLLDRFASTADLEVDGGVSEAVAPDLVRRGATVLVAGSAVHRHPSGRGAAIQGLREAALSGAERNHRPAADLPADAAMPTGRSAGRQRGAS